MSHKKFGPDRLTAVLTFIGYKQTNKQTNRQTDNPPPRVNELLPILKVFQAGLRLLSIVSVLNTTVPSSSLAPGVNLPSLKGLYTLFLVIQHL